MKQALTMLFLALILPGGLFILAGLIIHNRRTRRPQKLNTQHPKLNTLAHLDDNTKRPADIEPGIL